MSSRKNSEVRKNEWLEKKEKYGSLSKTIAE